MVPETQFCLVIVLPPGKIVQSAAHARLVASFLVPGAKILDCYQSFPEPRALPAYGGALCGTRRVLQSRIRRGPAKQKFCRGPCEKA
jgi:hypothetical protein